MAGMVQPESRGVSAGGVTFAVAEMGAGAPLVLLHGGGPGCTAWTDFGPVAPLFAGAGRRVVLVDLLQYGGSDMAEITGPMWDHHARKIVDLMDVLGIGRADFVCNSWGGTVALDLAAGYPERARNLVVTGSMPVFEGEVASLPETGPQVRARAFRRFREEYYGGEGPTREKMRALIGSLEWFDASRVPEETVELRWRTSVNPVDMALAMSDNPRGQWQDLTEELGRVQSPVLFLWGMQDPFLSPEYALMLARMVPHGSLHVMDRASHHLQEERPEEFVAIAGAFLDRPN